ncbi:MULTISPECIES: coproporphyrinogen III oxidase family protein [unclassified Campylobacter]|uniref:coproporphyrinogen III oxidase family protein n=1 Tax=unclassified Campylobacter TaxID=2593542 RepID=UPI001237F24E|nr:MULTISPECIES: coproporphyrinogen III oxidase family protein [unclassified Campylobacter]KAA6227124.1 coproporphyrinogen III oxidase family protein [Campylobacter sp. LR185c]KAA6227479.1 coproporphyrinogen III oxidase family protein [Campylobacter sp. LR196d]KAA6228505.1 coproporphyrinogen III oxidase family protein [Campylobacter sp. LR286c]KAA6230896.1 coproporphyrinogen III oxidase family protein [Campylobacter sp. LR291e]KAA6233530.1 coproporphyrinogen III oxidase family protein [Campylo
MHFLQSLALKYSHIKMQKDLNKNLNISFNTNEDFKIPTKKSYMLYMHIPFCHTFCPYCSFHKYYYEEEKARIYFENLRKELHFIKEKGFDFHTLYVGGGTTLINENELLKTLELCKKLFNIKKISCESDPNHISIEQLSRFKGLIDRLSCGIQSFDNEILKKITRYEKFGSSEILQEKLSKAIGVLPIFSIDLIFNFPNQNKEMLLKDLNIAKSLSPNQITTYPLMKSNLTKTIITKALGTSLKDNEFEFYKIICEFFKDFKQNNAWSFALQKSDFNDEYVSSNNEYVGVGSGAFSFLNNRLLINIFDLDDYTKALFEKKDANIAYASFEKKEILKYLFLTELFSNKININAFNTMKNCNLKKVLNLEMKGLKACNAIIEENDNLINTDFGKYLCLTLMKDFYIGMDKIRAVFRENKHIYTKNNINIMKAKLS